MSLHTLLAAVEFLEDKDTGTQGTNAARRDGATVSSRNDEVRKNLDAAEVETAMAEQHPSETKVQKEVEDRLSKPQSPGFVSDATNGTPHRQEAVESNHIPEYSMTAGSANSSTIPYNTHVTATADGTVFTLPNQDTNANGSENSGKTNHQLHSVTSPSMEVLVARARLAIGSTSVAYGGNVQNHQPRFTTPHQKSNEVSVISMQPSGTLSHHRAAPAAEVNLHQTSQAWQAPAPKPIEKRILLSTDLTDPNFNTLLPSLIKTSEDEKVYAALQFKPMKRSVTLTHNQLEKNRRAHLKERFEALKSCIPRLGMRRSSNLTILKAALRHIQALKKKESEQHQLLDGLVKEKQAKMERMMALKSDLLKTVSSKVIDHYLEDCLNKDYAQEETSSVSSLQTSGMLEDDQQSTSTASEAEEEEMKASLSFLPRSPDLIRDIVVYPPTSNTNRPPRRRIVPTSGAQPPNSTQPPLDPQRPINTTNPSSEVRRTAGPQRSPMKLYGTPSGRSATPSPPSNCYSFFPRFHIGSGGSPPLLSSNNSTKLQKPIESMVFGQRTRTGDNGAVANPVYKVLSSLPLTSTSEPAKPANMVAGQSQVLNVQPTPSAVPAAAVSVVDSDARVSTPVSIRHNAGVVLGADGRVSLPSFSGYQVKVKYVNPTISVNANTTPSQSHMPMKKRHYDVSSFSAATTSTANRPRSFMSSVSDSTPKLTSLYVGATAAVLGRDNSETGISTSDTESDRDSPMFIDQSRVNAKVPQWMKSAAGREWTEYRNKDVTKKKPVIQVHPYEPPKASGAASVAKTTDYRPKATFSLWDRKHHAITMTTATNWRGKQLLTSKTKTSVISSGPPASSTLPAPTSMTQVSYTTLQKATKPTIPSALVVGQQNSASPQAVAVETSVGKSTAPPQVSTHLQLTPQPATSSDHPRTSVGANGVIHIPGQTIPNYQTLPASVAGNQMAYQIIQAPYMAPAFSTAGPVNTTQMASGSVQGQPAVAYVMNAPTEGKDVTPGDRSAVLAPANMPLMIPVGYVMYPGNIGVSVAQHGVQFANLQAPPAAKMLAQPAGQMSLQTLHSSGTKRPHSPPPADSLRKRAGSTDSASSSTVSVESLDNDKRDQPKRPRVNPSRDPISVAPTNHVVQSLPIDKTSSQAHTQFLVPGNHGFVMANNGSAIPINLLGYPLQSYPAGGAGGIQAVQMAGLPANQGGLGQILTLPQGIGLQLASSVAMTTSVGGQQTLTSPVTLQVMPAPSPQTHQDKPS